MYIEYNQPIFNDADQSDLGKSQPKNPGQGRDFDREKGSQYPGDKNREGGQGRTGQTNR